MLRFKLVDSVGRPGAAVNEDLFDWNAEAAWIMDGASGIGPAIIPGAASDPYWLVTTFNEKFKKAWRTEVPTKDLLRWTVESTIAQFDVDVPEPRPPTTERPTACLLTARLCEDKVEISGVGDCYLFHRTDKTVTAFGSKLGEVAAPVHRERERLQAAGVPAADLFQLLLPLERQVRAKANLDGGYAILDLTTRWIDKMSEGVFGVRAGDELLLMTDGFYRLIDTFHLYDPSSLINAAKTDGLSALYTELRRMEEGDADCVQYPRVKISDDATAALLSVERSPGTRS